MSLSKNLDFENAQTAVPCDACEDKAPGEYYCIECKHTLCPPCEKLHNKFTRGHNVVLRTQLGEIYTTILTCTDHGEQASFHCEKCNIPVCGKCITGEHRGHNLSDLNMVFDHGKKMLQKYISDMQQDVLPKLKKRRNGIIEQMNNYDNRIQQITRNLDAEYNAVRRQMDRIKDDKLKGLDAIRKSHSTTFDGYTTAINGKIDQLEGRILEYQNAIDINIIPAVISLSKRSKPIPDIGSEPDFPEPPSMVSLGIQELLDNLSKLHLTYPSPHTKSLHQIRPVVLSKFICPLKGFPSICSTKEGGVWLAGTESRKLISVNIKGRVLRKIKKNRIRAVAAMDNGDIVISPVSDDSSSVSRHLVDNSEKHVFDTKPFCSIGVSVTADQNILICTHGGAVVCTNAYGTNVKQIYKGSDDRSAIHALEIADGRYMISDQKNHAVVVISRDGKNLSTIKHTATGQQLEKPLGFALDRIGNILCTDCSNNCVYIMNQNHQMWELVGHSHGIKNPRWLAVDNENNLWITQNDGNVHIVKYLA